jgi:hypothetical protein
MFWVSKPCGGLRWNFWNCYTYAKNNVIKQVRKCTHCVKMLAHSPLFYLQSLTKVVLVTMVTEVAAYSEPSHFGARPWRAPVKIELSIRVSRIQSFWLLKCVNWNLWTSYLPEACWKGWQEREGRGRGWGGGKLNCLLSLPSFIPLFSSRMLGSAIKVSGQKRWKLLYIWSNSKATKEIFMKFVAWYLY